MFRIAASVTVCIIGLISLSTFYSFQPHHLGKKASLDKLITFLDTRNVHHVFSADCMLPYQIIFYSNERIIGRIPYIPGRYPPFKDSVDNAFYKGEPTALVGYDGDFYGMQLPGFDKVEEYFVLLGPKKKDMEPYFQFE